MWQHQHVDGVHISQIVGAVIASITLFFPVMRPHIQHAAMWGVEHILQVGPLPPFLVQCSAVQCSTVQCSAVQCSIWKSGDVSCPMQVDSQAVRNDNRLKSSGGHALPSSEAHTHTHAHTCWSIHIRIVTWELIDGQAVYATERTRDRWS